MNGATSPLELVADGLLAEEWMNCCSHLSGSVTIWAFPTRILMLLTRTESILSRISTVQVLSAMHTTEYLCKQLDYII